MELCSKAANQQVIGGLMHNTLLFLEYSDIFPNDFEKEAKSARICFTIIKQLYEHGAEREEIPAHEKYPDHGPG